MQAVEATGMTEWETAAFLCMQHSTLDHWLRGYVVTPPSALMVLDAYAHGWRPHRPWRNNDRWLATALLVFDQNIESFSRAIGVQSKTAGRYVRDGSGPKEYIMLAAEAWLTMVPEPLSSLPPLKRPVGRPPRDRSNDPAPAPKRPIGRPRRDRSNDPPPLPKRPVGRPRIHPPKDPAAKKRRVGRPYANQAARDEAYRVQGDPRLPGLYELLAAPRTFAQLSPPEKMQVIFEARKFIP